MTDNHLLLYRLAELMLQYEQHILPVDLLFDDEQIGDFVKSIQIDSPYQQMLLDGVLTESVRDEKLNVSFTVEGYFHFVLGEVIYNITEGLGTEVLRQIVEENKLNGAREGVEQCLIRDINHGNLERLMWFIDEGYDHIDICVKPLLECLKTQGSKNTIEKVLVNPTEQDWEALFSLDEYLEKLQLHTLRKTLLQELMLRNQFLTKSELLLGLKAIQIFDTEEGDHYLIKIDPENSLILECKDLLRNLGIVYSNKGNYNKAIEFYERSLDICLKTHGNQHTSTSSIYNNLGLIWRYKGYFKKANDYHIKSLEIDLKIHGDQHPSAAQCYSNLGIICCEIGKHNDSIDYFEKSLAINIKVHGEHHPEVSKNYNNLGNVYAEILNNQNALEYYEKSLMINLKIYGEENPSTGRSYGNLGSIWKDKGDYNKAISYYEKSLPIELKAYGDNHPATARTYSNLGCVWSDKGELDKALEYYSKSLDIFLKLHGEEHPETAIVLNNIGNVYQIKNDFIIATEYYVKAYDILYKLLGEDHPNTIFLKNKMNSISQ
jgi:tetratricopeptide (TPR) repeat protein